MAGGEQAGGERPRGRSNRPRRRPTIELTPAASGILREELSHANDTPIFKPEWFNGDPDIEIDAEEDHYMLGRKGMDKPQKMVAYPPYIRVSDQSSNTSNLVKGSLCRYILLLHSKNLTPAQIAEKLGASEALGQYSAEEIQAIIRMCELSGLDSKSPSTTESWENASIEGWWEESHCEGLRRCQPVGPEVTGYDCDQGWWVNRQNEENRNWPRWSSREIGPRSRR
jgi:hypothetical protein